LKTIVTTVCIILLCVSVAYSERLQSIFTTDFYLNMALNYGKVAENRAKSWEDIIKGAQNDSEWNKLNKVNRFFNQAIQYQDDLPLWGKRDYWASPVETIARGKGDCEDYAIAKFFSLTALGVPESKLRLMYVRQLTVNQPHMVLIYFETPKSIPLVLDNYNLDILPANKRPDLKPIYSFNGGGLWMAKAKGLGRKVTNSRGVSAWDNLLQRIEQGSLPGVSFASANTRQYQPLH